MIEDLRKQQMELVRRRAAEGKRRRRKRILILTPLLMLLLLAALLAVQILGNRHFEASSYHLRSEKVTTSVRLAVLSDLHSLEYGPENSELIEAIRGARPDLILMIGDMVNKDDTEFSSLYRLCEALGEVAPIYFTLGNHEGAVMYSRLDTVPLDEELTQRGVNVLINRCVEWKKEDTTIQLAGIATDEGGYDQWAREPLEEFWGREGYKIVLAHYPGLYRSKLKEASYDLGLAGHYHGGLICIPGMGGLYHPETGLFPEYWGGQYATATGTLIVSRGFGGHAWIPRLNNRPELVIIEISPNIQEG